jgi:hypothetical protein
VPISAFGVGIKLRLSLIAVLVLVETLVFGFRLMSKLGHGFM